MQTTIDTLNAEVQKSQSYLTRARAAETRGASGPDASEALKIPGDQR
jgi:hypothetical protein